MKYKTIAEMTEAEPARVATGFEGLDKVLNGGFVGGAVVLFAGVTGSGKSTLLLQIANNIASEGHRVLYVSGEESLTQIKKRATRLGIDSSFVYCSEETSIEEIVDIIMTIDPKLVVIDSLQTMRSKESTRSMGTPTQMKLVLEEVINTARSTQKAIVVVGHSTKGGHIAGLQTLQHWVDTTLYLDAEGELRTLEVKKNRFGASYIKWGGEMTEKGLVERTLKEKKSEEEEEEKPQEAGCLSYLAWFLIPFAMVWALFDAFED